MLKEIKERWWLLKNHWVEKERVRLKESNLNELGKELEEVNRFRRITKLSVIGISASWFGVATSVIADSRGFGELVGKFFIAGVGVYCNTLACDVLDKAKYKKADLIKSVQRERLVQLHSGLPEI